MAPPTPTDRLGAEGGITGLQSEAAVVKKKESMEENRATNLAACLLGKGKRGRPHQRTKNWGRKFTICRRGVGICGKSTRWKRKQKINRINVKHGNAKTTKRK